MKMEISKQQLASLLEAHTLAVELFGDQRGSSFKDSIVTALVQIARGEQSSHSWVKPNIATGGATFDSKRREEGWISEMLDQVFTDYDLASINDHKLFVHSEEYTETVKVLTRYYASTGYFSRQLRKVAAGNFLSRHEYNRMCQNKYAQKVMDAHNSDPKFPAGTLVDFRAQHSETSDVDGKVCYKRAPLGLLVLSTSEPIISAAVGAKRYKVAPVGDSGTPFYVEERYLKKRKKRK